MLQRRFVKCTFSSFFFLSHGKGGIKQLKPHQVILSNPYSRCRFVDGRLEFQRCLNIFRDSLSLCVQDGLSLGFGQFHTFTTRLHHAGVADFEDPYVIGLHQNACKNRISRKLNAPEMVSARPRRDNTHWQRQGSVRSQS
jgi:hypothetical protein